MPECAGDGQVRNPRESFKVRLKKNTNLMRCEVKAGAVVVDSSRLVDIFDIFPPWSGSSALKASKILCMT